MQMSLRRSMQYVKAKRSSHLFQSKILSERDKKNLTIQKTIVQGKFIDVIAINDDEVQSPVFETFDEADYPIFRKKYMSLPIYDSLN